MSNALAEKAIRLFAVGKRTYIIRPYQEHESANLIKFKIVKSQHFILDSCSLLLMLVSSSLSVCECFYAKLRCSLVCSIKYYTAYVVSFFPKGGFMQGIAELPQYLIGQLRGSYCSRVATQWNTVESMYTRNKSKGGLNRFVIDFL